MSESWSRIRKKLEQEFLCESLRGRVQYFFTIYHGAPDEAGRFAVRVDGKEIWRAHPFNEGAAYDRIARELKQEQNTPCRKWDGKHMLYEEENREVEAIAVQIAHDRGLASTWETLKSIEEYLNQSIEDSFNSKNPIIRMLVILDRRVGKRTLKNMQYEYENGPQWLRDFYNLRIRAEGLTDK